MTFEFNGRKWKMSEYIGNIDGGILTLYYNHADKKYELHVYPDNKKNIFGELRIDFTKRQRDKLIELFNKPLWSKENEK